MKEYKTEQIRNVVLLGHGGTGKTSLAEAALFATGALSRQGKVDDGTTTSDFEPDEVKRKISLSLALVPCEWSGHKINIIESSSSMPSPGCRWAPSPPGPTPSAPRCRALSS
jgi:elongation factor G